MLPYFLFSANAGQLADKYEKSGLMRAVKIIEICLMALAAFAFIKQMYAVLFLVLFLMYSLLVVIHYLLVIVIFL